MLLRVQSISNATNHNQKYINLSTYRAKKCAQDHKKSILSKPKQLKQSSLTTWKEKLPILTLKT